MLLLFIIVVISVMKFTLLAAKIRSFRDITKGYADLFFFFCKILRQVSKAVD